MRKLQYTLMYILTMLTTVSCGFTPVYSTKNDEKSNKNSNLTISCIAKEKGNKAPESDKYCYYLKQYIVSNHLYEKAVEKLEGDMSIELVYQTKFAGQTQIFFSFVEVEFDAVTKYESVDKKQQYSFRNSANSFTQTMSRNMATEFSSEEKLQQDVLQDLASQILYDAIIKSNVNYEGS